MYGVGGRSPHALADGALDQADLLMYGLGIGPTAYLGRTTVDVEAMAWHVLYGDQRPWGARAPDDLNLLAQLRVVVGLPLGRAHLIAGAAANTFVTTDAARPTFGARTTGTPMAPTDGAHVSYWSSFFVGVRI